MSILFLEFCLNFCWFVVQKFLVVTKTALSSYILYTLYVYLYTSYILYTMCMFYRGEEETCGSKIPFNERNETTFSLQNHIGKWTKSTRRPNLYGCCEENRDIIAQAIELSCVWMWKPLDVDVHHFRHFVRNSLIVIYLCVMTRWFRMTFVS